MSVNVAIVGLRFGAEFVPIYRDHPDVGDIVVSDLDGSLGQPLLSKGATRVAESFDEILADPSVDVVHVVTPPTLHGPMAIKVLESGKHCASAIPAALDLADLAELVRLQASTGRHYMMMETAVYYPAALEAKALLEQGAFGNLTFGRGAHFQDMTAYPSPFFLGFPPHWNITHAIGPLLTLIGQPARSVRCLGGGRLPQDMENNWGNPFPFETAIFDLVDSPVALEVSRSMSHFAHMGVEGFALYGDRLGFEAMSFYEDPTRYEWTPEIRHPQPQRRASPDYSRNLPETLQKWGRNLGRKGWEESPYWGALAHLINELISSIVDERKPALDAVAGAEMTAAGIAAHASAMAGGTVVEVPSFREHG